MWIGTNLTTMDSEAFYGCTKLRGLYFSGNAPVQWGDNVCKYTRENFTIYYDSAMARWSSPFQNYKAVGCVDLAAAYANQEQEEIAEAKALKVSGLSTALQYNGIKVYWTMNPSAETYTVYRATSKNGTYKKLIMLKLPPPKISAEANARF